MLRLFRRHLWPEAPGDGPSFSRPRRPRSRAETTTTTTTSGPFTSSSCAKKSSEVKAPSSPHRALPLLLTPPWFFAAFASFLSCFSPLCSSASASDSFSPATWHVKLSSDHEGEGPGPVAMHDRCSRSRSRRRRPRRRQGRRRRRRCSRRSHRRCRGTFPAGACVSHRALASARANTNGNFLLRPTFLQAQMRREREIDGGRVRQTAGMLCIPVRGGGSLR